MINTWTTNIFWVLTGHDVQGEKKTRRHHLRQTSALYVTTAIGVLTVLLTVIIELCWYPGRFFAVPAHNVEVCQKVEGDLYEELKAEESQDAEVNIGQLSRKGLVGELPARLWHFLSILCRGGLWFRMKARSDATQKSTRVAHCSLKGTEQSAGPDKAQPGKKGGLQLPPCFWAANAMLS